MVLRLVGHCLAFLRGDEGLAYIRSENRHGVDGPVPVTAPPRRNLRPRARGRGLFLIRWAIILATTRSGWSTGLALSILWKDQGRRVSWSFQYGLS